MRRYLQLASHPDARWPLATSSLTRITPGMMALAVVLLARDVGLSYAVAGLLTGAHQVGVGLGSPVQGKLVDRFGQTPVLIPDAVAYLAGTATLAAATLAGAPVWLLVTVAVVTGATYPPTTACSRVVLSRLFPSGPLRETAFAVSSIAVELGFIVGPLAATALAATVGSHVAIVTAGAASAVGTVAFAATGTSRRMPRRDVAATGRHGALRSVGIRVVMVAIGATAVVFGAIDVVLPAVAEFAGDRAAAGGLLAAVAAGSLVGGVTYGARSWPGTLRVRLTVLLATLAGSLGAVPLVLPDLPAFHLALFVGGLSLGPATIVAFQLIDDLALPGTQTEAQSWTQSAVVLGVASGAAGAGVLVERTDPGLALQAGAVAVALGALAALLGRRWLHTAAETDAAAVEPDAAVVSAEDTAAASGAGPLVGTPPTPEDVGVVVGVSDEVVRGAAAERLAPRRLLTPPRGRRRRTGTAARRRRARRR